MINTEKKVSIYDIPSLHIAMDRHNSVFIVVRKDDNEVRCIDLDGNIRLPTYFSYKECVDLGRLDINVSESIVKVRKYKARCEVV